MKANVQYNDFIGTAAADKSDHLNLHEFLSSRGLDIDRYETIGLSFFSAYTDFFTVSIICIDKEKSSSIKSHIVKIVFEEFDKNDFFDLFKRFNVVLTKTSGDYSNDEIDEEVSFNGENFY